MKIDSETVGIGLPIYNNEKFLRPLLDSIVVQTYENFILYISDDCSTDNSEAICREYAARDTRIRYTRNETNLGANANNRNVLAMAETEYFMFSRGHEIMAENLLEELLKTLNSKTGAVLAFSETVWIDDENQLIPSRPRSYFDTSGLDVVSRCAVTLWGNWDYYYGLSRTETFRSIRSNINIIGNDLISTLEKALLGSFAHAPNTYRCRRNNYSGESYRQRMRRYRETTYKNLGLLDRFLPLFRLPFHIFYSVFKADIRIGQKIMITFLIITAAPLRYLVSRDKSVF